MAELLESFVNIAYEILSTSPPQTGQTSIDVIHHVTTNELLMAELARHTNLSTEYINKTILSVLYSVDRINEVYQWLNSTQNEKQPTAAMNTTEEPECLSTLAPEMMIVWSLIPALIILFILSMVTSRVWRTGCFGGRPGLAIPVNLLDSFENRFCYGFAFGATATRIIFIILDNNFVDIYGPTLGPSINSSPSYAKAILKIVAAILLGVSYYPFFACLSTPKRLLGAIIGTIYSTIWLLSYILQLAECGVKTSSYDRTVAENILLSIPPIFCHGFLVLCFAAILVRSIVSRRRGMVISKDEWKENYKYLYVKKILKPIPKSEQTVVIVDGFKRKIATNMYKWRPGFKYSTRIICIYVTACISLYLLVVNFVSFGRILFKIIKEVVEYFETSSELRPEDKELWSRIKEGVDVATICWMVSIAVAVIKDLVMIANMLSWYRGHVIRLQHGDRSFLPVDIDDKNPTDIMVASFKFAGYQVSYIVWGFALTQIVIFLVNCVLAFLVIWPLTWGGFSASMGAILAVTVWPTIFVSLMTLLFQKLLAKFVFLRDRGAALSLNNRRLYHICSYFFFFLNIFVGLFSCLMRIFFAMAFGLLFLPRLQKSALPRDWELFDPGYKTYVGYLCLEHSHTNPILCTFSQLLLDDMENIPSDGKTPLVKRKKKLRNRWYLLLTLINNPELCSLRRQEKPKSVAFSLLGLGTTAIMVTGANQPEEATLTENSVL